MRAVLRSSSRSFVRGALVLALAACESSIPPPEPDARVAPDARPSGTDGGALDDGSAPDGSTLDGGSAPDGATASDGGPTADGGAATCGDRRITAPEQCDDGNTAPGDGCDATCRREPSASCGDTTVDRALGEECDDGDTAAGDGCGATCLVETGAGCGDGALEPAALEECDDGNVLPGDGCGPTCQLEPVGAFCGDGATDPGELCDDGDTTNGDACSPTCNFANATTLFAGSAGMAGATDGVGSAARFGRVNPATGACGATGGLSSDNSYVYVGDSANRVLRRIEVSTATVSTIAGDGAMRVMDHATGVMASFNSLEAITTDGTRIWVADSCRIREVDAAPPHAVRTVAGGACAASAAAIADGTGTAATWSDLRGLTYYGGLVYSVDANAAVVRSFDPASGVVTTIAGTAGATGFQDAVGATARFTSPRYMASDNSGMLYIADTNGGRIRALNTVTREVTTFAGDGTLAVRDGTGTGARIDRPRGMTSDGTSIYFAEFDEHLIRQGVLATGVVSTMIGTAGTAGYVEGTGTGAELSGPFGITFHFASRSLFWLDGGNCVIRRVR